MQSIAELRKICQTAFFNERANPYGRFIRFFSIYVTRLLIPPKITANQVSLFMILVGVVGTCFFASASRWLFLTGAVLVQLWYTLDGVDGEVARYHHFQNTGSILLDKKGGNLTGIYLDMINHYIMNQLVPIMIAFGVFLRTGAKFWILLGILGSLGQVLMLALHDARSRSSLVQLKSFHYVEILDVAHASTQRSTAKKTRSIYQWLFMALHQTLTYPAVINLVGTTAILNLLAPQWEWRLFLVLYLAFGSLVVSATLIGRAVLCRTTEEEFHRLFRPAETPTHTVRS